MGEGGVNLSSSTFSESNIGILHMKKLISLISSIILISMSVYFLTNKEFVLFAMFTIFGLNSVINFLTNL